MSHSEQINEIAGALAAAQLEMGSAQKNCTNPHFKSKYADINDFILAVRPHLAKHGISLSQMPDPHPTLGIVLETMLIHKESGQWLKSTLPINCAQGGNQLHALGSALTYLRRFCLSAICGIASDEDMDDDGNSSGSYDTKAAPSKHQPPAQSNVKMATAGQVQALEAKMLECSPDFKKHIAEWMSKNNLKSYSDFNEQTFLGVFQSAIEDQKELAKGVMK